ncbi:hypothetical protein CA85_52830 [Allorhodopirellula solitaria]|uniref:Uncharacterized protein n=1 Tax=Allorhodopirellula solitaria TaxID=2527987 RepID=A0A5C5WIR1_9BACT|nr:hypothetical protein CA85_52830 [Allorhodopirellula solitaria]
MQERQRSVDQLQRISIRDSSVEGDFLKPALALPNLRFLTVSGCKLSPDAFQSLSDSRVKYLFCAHTDLDSVQVADLAKSEQIAEVTIQVPHPTSTQLLQLARMRQLERLVLVCGKGRNEIRKFFSNARPEIEIGFLDPLTVVTREAFHAGQE